MNTDEPQETNEPQEIDLSGMSRGTQTIEELEEQMSPAAIDMVDGMADGIIKKDKRKKRKFNSRDRSAWERMNRPERLEKMELGFQRIYNLIAGKGFITDSQVPQEPKEVL